ncbi:MAG TPA: hypothetical protein VGD87_08410 [Archangium sp.]
MIGLSFILVLSSLPGFELPDGGVAPHVEPPFQPVLTETQVAPPPEPPKPVVVVAAPDAGVAPAPASAASVLDQVFSWIRPYAVVKPTVIASGSAVESYSQPNGSAITAAGNPVLANLPDDGRLTFQVAQSRAGLWLNEKGVIRARLEVDFIDFTKATPTVASLPRIRLAYAEWAPADLFTLSAGQDWDLHAPVNPHGGNMVGGRFLSGNSGFMRQQVKALFKVNEFELAAAVGMQGANAGAKDAALELAGVPTFAVRGAWTPGKAGRVGVSGLVTSLRLAPGAATERRAMAGGVSAFGDLTLGTTNVRFELNLGRNMSNIGLLTLGFGNAAVDVDEWGGFLSVRHGFTAMHFVYASAGLQRVLTPRNVRPSYGYASMPADGSAPAMSSAALTGTGPGILHNAGANLGYELRISKNLSFMLEGFFLQTEHVLADVDVQRTTGHRRAWGGELAAFVSF